MDSRIRRLSFIAAVLTVAFAMSVPISGTFGIVGNAQAPAVETVLRMGFLQSIDSMNPYVGLNDASYIFYGLVYDGLMVVDNDLQPTPDLALEAWAVPESDPQMQLSGEPYGSVWQYNLTVRAMWHDGEPFTADDVVWNMNLNAGNFTLMWAYQPYSYFMKDAEKIDEQTVRVHFYDRATGDPMPASYAYLISIPMLPKHKLEAIDPFTIGFSWSGVFDGEDLPIVGTGPFTGTKDIRQEWLAGDHITLVKNANCHWQSEYGKEIQFDKLVMRFYDHSTAMRYALENNQIDVASFPPGAFRNIENDIGSGTLTDVTTFEGPKITQYWTEVGFNMNNDGPNPSRLDHTIRLAAAMATNKTYIVQQFYLGMAEEGSTLIPSINPWHYEPDAAEIIPYDLDVANALLEAAGYRDTDMDGVRECTAISYAVLEGLVVEGTPLVYDMMVRREYPEEKDIAMYLQNEWAKIGIDIHYRILDEAMLGTIAYSYTYDTLIWFWSGDIDPNFQLYACTEAAWGGWSDNLWTNASYEENYTMSVQSLDPVLRKQYVDNCQLVHYLDVPYIIMAYTNQTYAWRTDTFTGWGDWAADPGRSIDNYWMGNPLYFDLVPIPPPNQPPSGLTVTATPDTALLLETVAINVSAVDQDGDLLSFYIEFGDGNSSVASGLGGYDDPQYANLSHAYSSPGTYTVTVWANDSSGLPGHNVSTSCTVLVLEEIPEFATVLLPSAAVMAFVLAAGYTRRRRRGQA